ncbi:leukocyte surface antigen CD47 [Numenius arquata]|uniref:leukocyte surface antigen CD47 n=1 Tax=Numenius arquata TaxID=31919 RepID=UPI003D30C8B6
MWQLTAWVLLSAVGAGSAQLLFNATDVVKKTDCNKTVILPCYVINLNENNVNIMFVTWKRQGKIIFSFDGARKEFFRDPTVPSANLLSEADLPKGIASLRLNSAEAEVGNYSCEVTESNREGETRLELKKYAVDSCGEESTPPTPKEKCGSWFLLVERALIISLLFLIITLWLAQLSLIALKYDIETQKRMGIIIFDNLPQATFVLVGLQILGYVIAVAGFVLCVPACPPIHASVIIAGLAILAIANLLSLGYVFIMGSRMKDHPRPGKAVEEPLNELKSYVIREKYTVVDTPWP